MKDELMTVKEVAMYIRVSESKIYRMVRSNSLPFIKIDGKYLFRVSSINEFLKSNETSTI